MGGRMSQAKLSGELHRIRDKITAAKDGLRSLDEAKTPRDHADAAIDRLIDTHAERGSLALGYIADGMPLPNNPSSRSAFDLLCWLAPELVRAKCCAELDRIYAVGQVQDPQAARSARSKLMGELFDLEVEEERLIMQAETLGFPLSRRGDADPRAVLEA